MRRLIGLVLALLLAASIGVPSAAAQSPIGNPIPVGVRLVADDGLTSPVALIPAPDNSGRLFIVDQIGLIRILGADGRIRNPPFLDVRNRLVRLDPSYDERGLLGLAFHPNYASNGRFFVFYNAPLRPGAPAGYDDTVHVSEFHVSATDPNAADPGSERILLEVDKPQFNHNGGELAFGRDGYLYISIGDGGGADDVGLGHVQDWYERNRGGNGQDITHNLLGNILRIDVNTGSPYGIPPDNPFVGKPGLDEIYAYGFRNPYRFSFDQGGQLGLLVGDAGQNLWEEVSQVSKGGNYGWNVKEGTHCFSTADPNRSYPTCPSVDPTTNIPLTDPVIEFANSGNPVGGDLGVTVVGGYVYRGQAVPSLQGKYVFGSWSISEEATGLLFAATPGGGGLWTMQELRVTTSPTGRLGHYVLAFGQGPAGEVYVLTSDVSGPSGRTGKIFKLTAP